MVFNVTFIESFNNLSAISVLLVEKTGVPGETNDLPQVTDQLDHQNCIYFKLRTF